MKYGLRSQLVFLSEVASSPEPQTWTLWILGEFELIPKLKKVYFLACMQTQLWSPKNNRHANISLIFFVRFHKISLA